MNFSLSETQQQLKDLANQIIGDSTSPAQLKQHDKNGYFDRVLWQTLADAGLLSVAVDEAYGGMGLDFETLCVLFEAAGKHACPTPLLSVLTPIISLQKFAPTTVLEWLLPDVISGKRLITSIFEGPKLSAENVDDNLGHIQLNGSTGLVTTGFSTDDCLVLAEANNELVIALVTLEEASCTRDKQQMTNGEYAAILHFNQAPAQVITRGKATVDMLALAANYAHVANAAYALGLTEAMVSMASEYTAQRKQFGKAIGSFQAVQHQLADAFIDKECLRAATENAVYHLSQDEISDSSTEASLIAKIWLGDALHNISHTSQHVHGGTGVDRDYGLFRFCTAAKTLELQGGSSASTIAELGKRI